MERKSKRKFKTKIKLLKMKIRGTQKQGSANDSISIRMGESVGISNVNVPVDSIMEPPARTSERLQACTA